MMPWFIWKGKNSYGDFGIWIGKLPKIIRPKERYLTATVPGRPGSLTLLEGEDVYDGYTKECTIIITNRNPKRQQILDWLRGSGEVVFSNEIDRAYIARIAAEVAFERIGNDLMQAKIVFMVEPFKKGRNEARDRITMTTATQTVHNPGDVASRPMIKVEGTGEASIVIGTRSMVFEHLPGEIMIDCDADVITTKAAALSSSKYYYVGDYATDSGHLYRFTSEGLGSVASKENVGDAASIEYIWPGWWDGEILRIPKGSETIICTPTLSPPTLTIDPRWRWV